MSDGSGIAIVGMAGRFPGARNLEEFWRNLEAGVESIRSLTAAELEARGVAPELLRDPQYVRAEAVPDGVELFDAAFFGMTAREAEIVDPQHRVFLETAWQGLEDAGYDSESYQGSVGVYAGATINTYLLFHLRGNPEIARSLDLAQLNIASGRDFLTTRVSYKLNLKGPSHLVQSACSTSLVAVHLAAQSLFAGQCDLALAGGVSVNVKMMGGYRYVDGGMASPDGHCRAFDARAAGTVFGGGAGVVVLKRLEDALAEGDTIRAVIKGSAINNDGAAKVGYTAPSVEGQAKVITEALADAGVEPETVSYVETHGTGTPLGDPIEVRALNQAFRAGSGAQGYCALGSVKSNIGHLDAAAGVTSLIKTVLALEHEGIPPSLHFERPNPNFELDGSPFFVNTRLTPWPRGRSPRRAGVSSFGVGGTNAHVIVEEAPVPEPPGASRPWQLLTLSARTAAALDQSTANLAACLERRPGLELADVAYTLSLGRRRFRHRRMLVAADTREAAAVLEARAPARVLDGCAADGETPVVFLFAGASPGRRIAGRELYRQEPVFRERIDVCSELARPHLSLALAELLYAGAPDAGPGEPPLPAGRLAEVAAFAADYALGQLWLSWGVRPQAMLGEGGGEVAAACLADALSLADALALAAARGELLEAGAGGAARGDAARAFAGRVRQLEVRAPAIPYVSSLTGSWVSEREVAQPEHWTGLLGDGERSGDGLAELLKEPARAFLEVGWGASLGRRVAAHPARRPEQLVLSSLPEGGDQPSEAARLLATLGRLWLGGVAVDWSKLYGGQRRRRVPLPTYPFERQRYWIEPVTEGRAPAAVAPASGKQPDVADWFYRPAFRRLADAAGPEPAPAAAGERWLVLLDRLGLGSSVAERLRDAGREVVEVTAGSRFARAGAGRYTVGPRSLPDYQALLEALGTSGEAPIRVLYLWSLTPAAGAPAIEPAAPGSWEAFTGLLLLAQAAARREPAGPLTIDVVANQALAVTEEEEVRPEQAALVALSQALPLELSGVVCRLLDVPAADLASARGRRRVDRLLAELHAGSREAVVALRGSQRWSPTFEPVPLAGAGPVARPRPEGGVYLLTDGAAGPGGALAETLARTRGAKLALLESSRSRDGAGGAWTEQRRRRLEELGAEVWVLRADPTSEGEMRRVVGETIERFGALHGVVHGTGENRGRPLVTIGEAGAADLEAALGERLAAATALGRALAETGLDFCLLVSSLSSVLGRPGALADAAVERVLQAWAERARQVTEVPWLAVSWEPRSAAAVPAPGVPPPARHPRPALRTPFVAPSTPLERRLARVWQDALGLEAVGVDDVFFELGGDSLVAVQVMDALTVELDRRIPAVSLYEELTVRALAELLAAEGDAPAVAAPAQAAGGEGRTVRRKEFQEQKRLRRKEHGALGLRD